MLEIDPQIRAKIVKLRKSGSTISAIAEGTDTRVSDVMSILKEELGEWYDNYSQRCSKSKFSEQEIKRIVDLRKDGNTLRAIRNCTKISLFHIQRILKEELGNEYLKYLSFNQYEKYRKGWCQEEVAIILKLRKSGKGIEEIKKITGLPLFFVKRILIEEGKEDLRISIRVCKKPFTKEETLLKFERWYYKFANELHTNSAKETEKLKLGAIKIFFGVLEALPHSSSFKNPNKLMPVFVYSFLRARGFDISFSLLSRLSGMTKHECFQTLKKITVFPEYVNRDRKQLILGKIHEVEKHFHLSSQFFENANRILQKLWELLKNTTDSVIAGTVAALSLISIHNNLPILKWVCQKIGISQSTVIFQVKNKIVKRLGISGFTTFNNSKEVLISGVLEKIVDIQMAKV